MTYMHSTGIRPAAVILASALLAGCAGEPSRETAGHSFPIAETTKTCTPDGAPGERFWKSAAAMGGFRIDADPSLIPEVDTRVRAAYSNRGLMVLFECDEPEIQDATDAMGEDASRSDNCELLIFSRPETPWYSPYLQRLDYMNANDFVRTQRRFLVDPRGRTVDSDIHKNGPHTPYITDDSWEGAWSAGASISKHGYTVEIFIPWDTIGGMPGPGHDFRLHFVRRRSAGGGELHSFNWCKNENVYAPSFDPADFNQEHPLIFAPVTFSGGGAVLDRFIETEAPWKIERRNTVFGEVLTDEPDPFRAAHFYLGIRGFLLPDSIRTRYDDATWTAEERHFITETGRAGMNGPFLPGFMNMVGVSGLDSLNAEYGMRFTHHAGVSGARAKELGATILRPRGTAAFFDPVHVRLKTDALASFLERYGDERWLFDIRGQDEPFNQIASILQPGTWEWANGEIVKRYGVGLGVPVGVPDVPYQNQPVHENSRGVPDHDTALSRIAMFRWLNGVFRDAAKREHDTVRRHAPGKLYQAYNRNAVADLDFLDMSLYDGITDYHSADPYPSFCSYVYGTARSRYHVGFTSKMVTDLAAGKPTQMIIQGCDMIQRYSTPGNVREWASQAAKAGVSMLDWWGTPRLDHPDLYREMLRLSRLWMKLPELDIPERTDIAVLYSDDSRVAAGDEGLHAHYTLHVILGEKLGAWYRFVSENHVRRGLHSLDGVRLIIAPHLAYLSAEFADDLAGRVESGSTLVLLDPDAFTHDIETGPVPERRMRLTGLGECAKRHADTLLPTEAGRARFGGSPLPVRPLRIRGDTGNARVLDPPADARVLYTYADGEPAAFSRKLGAGEVLMFGAMPFQDSECATIDSGWDALFSSLVDENNIERNMPLWNFMFPESGGGVETFDLLK